MHAVGESCVSHVTGVGRWLLPPVSCSRRACQCTLWVSRVFHTSQPNDAGHHAAGCCRCTCGQCGVPQVIAFSGKRQWSELINIGKRGKAKVTNIPTGLQPTDLRPPVRHQSMAIKARRP